MALLRRNRNFTKIAPEVMNGARYIESLRDGREVWLHGEKVKDVTRHPAFANVICTIADLHDPAASARHAESDDLRDGSGVRSSVSYMPPMSPAELLQQRRNTEYYDV
jgi:aromatic ring hydroxylase